MWQVRPMCRSKSTLACTGSGVDPAGCPTDRGDLDLGLSLQGLWSHFAVSEEVDDFTEIQIDRFDEAVSLTSCR